MNEKEWDKIKFETIKRGLCYGFGIRDYGDPISTSYFPCELIDFIDEEMHIKAYESGINKFHEGHISNFFVDADDKIYKEVISLIK